MNFTGHKNGRMPLKLKQPADRLYLLILTSANHSIGFIQAIHHFPLNNIYYRRSNFNFWPLEASLQGREVLVLSPDNWRFFSKTVKNTRKLIGATVVNPYFSFSQIAILGPKIIQAKAGKVGH